MSDSRAAVALAPDELRWCCDPQTLPFATTADLRPCADIIGQKRAVEAIELGLAIDRTGYNIFITGLSGTGRTTTIKCLIEQLEPAPKPLNDYLYVHNFTNPDAPRAVILPAGQGRRFRSAMREAVATLESAIPGVFESEEYLRRSSELVDLFRDQERAITRTLDREVERENFRLVHIQLGTLHRTDIVPIVDDKPVAIEELETRVERKELDPEKLAEYKRTYEALTGRLQETLQSVTRLHREFKAKSRELDLQSIRPVVAQVVDEVRQQFSDDVLRSYFDEVEKHISENPIDFRPTERPRPELPEGARDDGPFAIYQVNLLVDNSGAELPPVIVETSPSYRNLFGTLERYWDRTAAVLEESMREAGRREKLSTRFNSIIDILREADFYARKAKREAVQSEDVVRVATERRYRLGLIEEKILELIEQKQILVDTVGSVVGQVNGLAVLHLSDYIFAKPSRVTARTGLGKSGIVNIEREAELSGSSHSKGVLILNGFFQGRFAQDKPLPLAASVAFEQSYEGVDGDSASSTELYALLSSIADVPIRQDIAVTGSVNQRGQVQAIGGVNYKIEGFFDACRLGPGLTGTQGVVIPAANVPDLMLRQDVVAAAREGRFHVWSIDHVDQGIELLTGTPAGERDDSGRYPEGTINRTVDDRLRQMVATVASLQKSDS